MLINQQTAGLSSVKPASRKLCIAENRAKFSADFHVAIVSVTIIANSRFSWYLAKETDGMEWVAKIVQFCHLGEKSY